MSLCRWRRHGCMKSHPLTKNLWKKIWKIENIPGMVWQLHKSKYIRFKKHFSVQHCQSQILWSDMKSFSLHNVSPIRKKSGADRELTVTSSWAHREFTVTKMQSRDLAVSSPWSKCSLGQFIFSWDSHTDLVLHTSSFAPFGTDWPFG